MIERALMVVGLLIDSIARWCLRRAYGLRIPAARLRLYDRQVEQEHLERLLDAGATVPDLRIQLVRAVLATGEAADDLDALVARANCLPPVSGASPAIEPIHPTFAERRHAHHR